MRPPSDNEIARMIALSNSRTFPGQLQVIKASTVVGDDEHDRLNVCPDAPHPGPLLLERI
jgi:hypothetical protein